MRAFLQTTSDARVPSNGFRRARSFLQSKGTYITAQSLEK